MQSHTLEGLAVYTQYLLSIKVYNPEGSGPETIVVVMTDEGGQYYLFTHMLIHPVPWFSPIQSTKCKSALNLGNQHSAVLVGA